ncbi:hypothetical protein [Paludifilum halophilum]|uniref:hypothetical protein n=1 Tax=Paludifilum halophilum TaxID=1642702 RepID=UPI0011400AE3|nr:hypothetical protein [Paludifilum halophilum]
MAAKDGFRFGVFLILFLLVSGSFPLSPAFAEEKQDKDLSRKVEKLEAELEKLRAKEESYDYLKEENREYRKFVEKEWDRFLSMLSWFFPLAITIIGALLLFLNFKSIRDIKATVREQVQEKADEELKGTLKKHVTQIEEDVASLKLMAARESWFKNANILVLDKGTLQSFLSSTHLSERENLIYASKPYEQLPHILEEERVDIVIYEYDKPDVEDEWDPHIIDVLNQLKQAKETIPVVIYCPHQLPRKEFNRISKCYRWYHFANTPITLITNVSSLSHVFYSKQHNENHPPMGERIKD